jgi:superoxide dismutase, Cu-Zn family
MYELAAVLRSNGVDADIHIKPYATSHVKVSAIFRALPSGAHGFHIHEAGDLRNDGCSGACSHYHKGPAATHGDKPRSGAAPRHTGDLGNVSRTGTYTYILRNVRIQDLVGRSVIVHADEDDLGKGGHEDSHTTGHSGARIACGVLGRVVCRSTTRRKRK